MSPRDPEAPEEERALHGPCGRAGLLLSLHRDGAATPDQVAELSAHLAACADCRRAERTDEAVRRRLAERAAVPVAEGAAARVLAAFGDTVRRERLAGAAQNRFLRYAAAAAVLVATAAGATSFLSHPADDAAQASVRDFTRWALARPEGR